MRLSLHLKLQHKLLTGVVSCAVFFASIFTGGHAGAGEPSTARGRVHLVRENENEVQREALSDVLVTDGFSFTETCEEGRYEIELNENARTVFFINPHGTMPTVDLHQVLPDDRESMPDIDFEVRPLSQSPDEPFYFLHHSDLHLARDYHIDLLYERMGRHIERMPESPLFALDSGDVSNDSIERMEWASELFDRYPIPVFTCKGNHDRDRGGREAFRGETMEQLFAPLYYGFTVGNYLFLNYPWISFRDQAMDWTEELLERIGDDYHVVVNLHHLDGMRGRADDLFGLLKEYDGKGLFWGHYHTSQIVEVDGIPTFGITSGRTHIRDLGRPAFSLIRAEPDGRMTADKRKGGFEKYLELVNPPQKLALEAHWGEGLKRGRSFPLLVNAYDTARDVASVSVTVTEPGGSPVIEKVQLEGHGAGAWTGRLEVGMDWYDPVLMFVEAVDESGAQWPVLERQVWVADPEPPVEIRTDENWGMYQGGPSRRGFSSGADIEPPLELAWVHVNRNFGLSAPVFANGMIFAGIMNNSEPSEPYPVLAAVDADTGETVWTHKQEGGRSPRSTPATDGSIVVYQACDGYVAALDAENGEILWESDILVSELAGAQVFLRASPFIAGNTVFVGAASFSAAFDLADGAVKWSRIPGSGSRSWANPSSAMYKDIVLSPEGGRLYARDPDDGTELWSSGNNNLTPAAGSNYIFVTDGDEFKAINPEDGSAVWATSIPSGRFFSSPAVGRDTVVLSQHHTLFAYSKEDGSMVWKTETGGMTASPVIAGQHVYCVTEGGRLLAVHLESGDIDWEFDLDTKVTSGIAVSGNTLFITGRNGALYAFSKP